MCPQPGLLFTALWLIPLSLILIGAPAAHAAIWVAPEEIARLPTSGPAWGAVVAASGEPTASPDLSNQDDPVNVRVLAKALVYARTGEAHYRAEAIAAIKAAKGTESGGRSLALGRELAAYIVAAELVKLSEADPTYDSQVFRPWLRDVIRRTNSDGRTLIECHETRPNNWGTHCGASRIAVAVYLNDRTEIERAADVFKGWLGDRASYNGFIYHGFNYGDQSWQCDASNTVGVNPKGCTKGGHSIDGVLPDDQRRAGGFTWPPPKENYVYEALQGALAQAVIFNQQGYDVWNWENKALLRAFEWLHQQASFPAQGDDTWQPWLVNWAYGTSFPAPLPSSPGKNVGWTDWTHAGARAPLACPRCADRIQNCGEGGVDCGGACAPCRPGCPACSNGVQDCGETGTDCGGSCASCPTDCARPYAQGSPWNSPIGPSPRLHPDSAQQVAVLSGLFGNDATQYTYPVYEVAGAQPLRTVRYSGTYSDVTGGGTALNKRTGGGSVQVPIPDGAQPSSGTDGQIIIVNGDTGDEWGFWQLSPARAADGSWTATNGYHYNTRWTGVPPSGFGSRGAGLPYLAGLIRKCEIEAGRIDHALAFAYDYPCSASTCAASGLPHFVSPATKSDGAGDAAFDIPEGARLQLDPAASAAEITAWCASSPACRTLVRALQEYGMYVVDNAGHPKVYVEDDKTAQWGTLLSASTVSRIPLSRFRVLDFTAGACAPSCGPWSDAANQCGTRACTRADCTASPESRACPPHCTTDADGDQYLGDEACPAASRDCADLNPNIYPGAPERCGNGLDDDCDSLTDEGCGCVNPPHCDADCDGVVGLHCGGPDCHDGNAAIRPNATENCANQLDDNCDQAIDAADAACGGSACTADEDRDGHKAGAACPAATADCDDRNDHRHPGAPEMCGNGVDEDCDNHDLPCDPGYLCAGNLTVGACSPAGFLCLSDLTLEANCYLCPCGPGQTCENNECVRICSPPCPSGKACREGVCVEGCAPPCGPGEGCEAGTCVPASCEPDWMCGPWVPPACPESRIQRRTCADADCPLPPRTEARPCEPASDCGNLIHEAGEECDGDPSLACEDLDAGLRGALRCRPEDCRLDTSACCRQALPPSGRRSPPFPPCGSSGGGPARCRNGLKEAGEACDGTDLGGQDCAALGLGDGTPACTPACTLDTAPCGSAPALEAPRSWTGPILNVGFLGAIAVLLYLLYREGVFTRLRRP